MCSLVSHLKWDCWWFRNPANSPVEVGSLSHYLQGFKRVRWCRISSINRINYILKHQPLPPVVRRALTMMASLWILLGVSVHPRFPWCLLNSEDQFSLTLTRPQISWPLRGNGGTNPHHTWRIIPVSKWLGTIVSKSRLNGLKMGISNYLLSGMILHVTMYSCIPSSVTKGPPE